MVGTVDATEIALVMDDLGNTYDEQTLQDMISDADEDGNGVIEEREFIAMMARQMANSDSEDEDDSGDSDVSDDEPLDNRTVANPVAFENEADT